MTLYRDSIYGSLLEENRPPQIAAPVISINGVCGEERERFTVDGQILSRHMMLIGGTGCGKTKTFFHLVSQLKSQMTADDVMIIFDTKGDYYKEFYEDGDYVISANAGYEGARVWNVFDEIMLDGTSEREIEANVSEITMGLYGEAIEKNSSNPFFPQAARDLLGSIITCLIRYAEGSPERASRLCNSFLREKLDTMDAGEIYDLIIDFDDQKAVLSYIGSGNNEQGMGVLSEMQTVIRRILVGEFAARGKFSMRRFIRERGAKALFIEYDLARGSTLTPIYKLLIDLALKEAMSRGQSKGNVYVFCDEFKLLPHLEHIEDAVNFGRSLGVKVFAGLQSIDQMYENYGEARGRNIIAGFSSVLSFRANDESTRKFATGLYGKNYYFENYHDSTNQSRKERKEGNIVEDWDIAGLRDGEAIVGIPKYPPYKFRFEQYADGSYKKEHGDGGKR